MTARRCAPLLPLLTLGTACAGVSATARIESPVRASDVALGRDAACAQGGLPDRCPERGRDAVASLLNEPTGGGVVVETSAQARLTLDVRGDADAVRVRARGNLRYEIYEIDGAGRPVRRTTGLVLASRSELGAVREIMIPPTREAGHRRRLELRAADVGDSARVDHVAYLSRPVAQLADAR